MAKQPKIVVRMYNIYTDAKGRQSLTNPRTLATIHFDDGFEFDVFNPENWRRWLLSYRTPEGKRFPTSSDGVDVFAYRIEMYSMPLHYKNDFLERYGGLPPSLYFNLFPGYIPDSMKVNSKRFVFGKIRDISIYGVI